MSSSDSIRAGKSGPAKPGPCNSTSLTDSPLSSADNMHQRKKVLGRRRELAGGGLQLNRLRSSAGDILTEYNPNYEFGGALPCTVKDLREIPRQNLTLVK